MAVCDVEHGAGMRMDGAGLERKARRTRVVFIKRMATDMRKKAPRILWEDERGVFRISLSIVRAGKGPRGAMRRAYTLVRKKALKPRYKTWLYGRGTRRGNANGMERVWAQSARTRVVSIKRMATDIRETPRES